MVFRSADLVKQFLHGCGIECVVHGRLASGVYPGFIGDLGKRDVLVLEDDADDARELLAEREQLAVQEIDLLLRLRRALDELVVSGIETTIPLFQKLVREPDIINGDYSIHWLEKYLASLGH